jgi:hypothetical protein
LVQAWRRDKEQQLLTQPLGFGGEKHDDEADLRDVAREAAKKFQ